MNHKFLGKNSQKLKQFKLNSDIKPISSIYELWIDLITLDGKKVFIVLTQIQGEKYQLDCVEFFDERGTILKEKITEHFSKLLSNSITLVNASLG